MRARINIDQDVERISHGYARRSRPQGPDIERRCLARAMRHNLEIA